MQGVRDQIQSLRDLLGDAQATVRTQKDELVLPCGALLDALEQCLPDCALDDFDADEAEAAPPPETTYVSPRNADPAYRAARDEFNRIRAAELAADAQKTADGPVIALPVAHRDDMSEESRAAHAWAGECAERYLGKDTGVYVVTLPDAGDPVLRLHLTLMRFCPGVEATSAVWDAIVEREAALQATFDRFPEDLRSLVQSGAFLLDDGTIPDPEVLGRVVDDETGEETGALAVAYRLADRLVMILLQSA